MHSDRARSLADQFAQDAEVLRARAAAPPAPSGPDPATADRMADACDRVSALFASAGAARDEALGALVPVLQRYEREERDSSVRAVYRGAMMRLKDSRVDA